MKVVSSGKTEKFTYSIKLSDERLKLFADLTPIALPVAEAEPTDQPETETKKPKKKPEEIAPQFSLVTKEELLAILPKEVWEACIHQDVLANIAKELSAGTKIEERRIAKGSAQQDGENGRFLLTVKKMSPKPDFQEDLRGFIDFKELHRFENVREGTIVAKLFPPTAGTPGTDPLGRSIAAKPGQVVKLGFDQSITAVNHKEGAGQDLVAAIEGYLSEDAGKLSIQKELKVSGAIDYKVGSIDFIGSVFIQGDVLPGFIVRGKKGVVVRGSVQEATITSSEGAVEVLGHCMGSVSCKIEAKTDVSLSVANQMEVEAGVSIKIIKEARDCQLRSAGTISGIKAALIGGKMLAACGVEAREIGARGGTRTSISLASDVAMTKEFAHNERLILEHEKISILLKAHLGPLAQTEAGLSELSDAHRVRLEPIVTKKRAVESSLVELKLKRQELIAKGRTNDVFRVSFIEKLHGGVVVNVGEEKYSVADDITGPKSLTFNFQNNIFELGELNALECSIVEPSKEKGDDRKRSK